MRIANAQGQQGVDLVTRSDGRAFFLSSWDNVGDDAGLTVTVTPPDDSDAVRQTVASRGRPLRRHLAGHRGLRRRQPGPALVLDATGSMGDEMEYLKSEIKSIAAAVNAKFPHVQQRDSLILYRDHGDEYVVRTFDFTDSVDELRKCLAAQRADGGGDYPEAVHSGLEEAGKLQWRGADTARVLFLVGDAPPHSHEVGKAMQAADALGQRGVVIYPVACSGYDDATELVMRTCAALTGGQFLFLTDDSGVGNAHGEPHLPGYHVQRLDRLMVRMISDELSGRRTEPLRDEDPAHRRQPATAGELRVCSIRLRKAASPQREARTSGTRSSIVPLVLASRCGLAAPAPFWNRL